VVVELPSELSADIVVGEGDLLQRVTRSKELAVDAGLHTIRAHRVVAPGDVVGRAYYPKNDKQTVCVVSGATAEIKIKYALESGSEKLWVITGGGTFHTASFGLAALAASGTPTPAATIAGAALSPRALAFDAKGSLWLADVSGKVLGYQRDSLGTSRSSSTPDILLEGPSLCDSGSAPCGPVALAFDAGGDLWLALSDSVVRIDSSELTGRKEPEPTVRLTGKSVDRPQALAFDEQGALWIANAGDSSVVRFSAKRLAEDDAREADATISGQASGPVFSALSNPSAIAFDGDGNLWVGYLDPSVVVRYSPNELGVAGILAPELQLSLDTLGLPRGLAFDDTGNLWITGEGKVSRVAAASLKVGGNPAKAAVILDVEGVVQDLAFDPPAFRTPLLR